MNNKNVIPNEKFKNYFSDILYYMELFERYKQINERDIPDFFFGTYNYYMFYLENLLRVISRNNISYNEELSRYLKNPISLLNSQLYENYQFGSIEFLMSRMQNDQINYLLLNSIIPNDFFMNFENFIEYQSEKYLIRCSQKVSTFAKNIGLLAKECEKFQERMIPDLIITMKKASEVET